MRSRRDLAKRFAKFGLVGASGTFLNLGLFSLLTSVANVHYLAAGPLAFEVSFFSNYMLHNAWTFRDRRASRLLSASLLKCQLVSGGALLISLATLFLSVNVGGVPPLVGNVAGVALATVWNFALSVRWTWRHAEPEAQMRPTRHRNQAPAAA